MSSEPEFEHGWRGISARVQFASPREFGDGWLAVATDPNDGQVAVALWEGEGPSRRHIAFWMDADAASKLVAALTEHAGTAHETPTKAS